jgi:hypothetical protein
MTSNLHNFSTRPATLGAADMRGADNMKALAARSAP